jgi:hypothetical protein
MTGHYCSRTQPREMDLVAPREPPGAIQIHHDIGPLGPIEIREHERRPCEPHGCMERFGRVTARDDETGDERDDQTSEPGGTSVNPRHRQVP